ncbi:MAG: fibronectin type III domain-containing protein [Thermoplasmata archaeon]|nr:fibronectin type III domain-containing protein [Thermoplasmata archaeon]
MRYVVPLVLMLMFFPPFAPVSDGSSDAIDAGSNEFDLIFENLQVQENENIVFENQTILVKGNITIYGSLTFRNCTVLMNDTSSVGPEIHIYGYMDLCDLDDDPQTMEDGSLLDSITGSLSILGMGHNSSKHLGLNSSIVKNSSIVRAYCRIRDSVLEKSNFDHAYIDGEDTEFVGCVFIDPSRVPRNCTFKGDLDQTAFVLNGSGPSSLTFYHLTFSGYGSAVKVVNNDVAISGCVFNGIDKAVDTSDVLPNIGNISIAYSHFIDSSLDLNNSGYLSVYEVNMTRGALKRNNGPTYIMDSEFYRIKGLSGFTEGYIRDSQFIECDVALDTPLNMLITGNHFIGCGLAIDRDHNCTIYHNGFIENVRNAGGFTASNWYHDILKEGNYFTSYHGDDNGYGGGRADDGIGDTALPHIGRDRYPLMQDMQWMMPPIKEVHLEYANGSSDVALNWTHSSNERYVVQRSWNGNFIADIDIWSIDLNRLTVHDSPNRTAYFRLQTFNEYGARGFSMVRWVDVDQVPYAPINVRSRALPEGASIEVTWDHLGEDISKVRILYGLVSQHSGTVADVEYPGNSRVLTSLQNGLEYAIGLMSIDSAGQPSQFSEVLYDIPIDTLPPPPPRNVAARAKSNSSIELTWSPPEEQDLVSYVLYRQGPDDASFVELTTLPDDVLSFLDVGLEDNTTYRYGVSALDEDGPLSDMGGPVEATTQHRNNLPESVGGPLFIEFNEDEGPVSLDLSNAFFDPDGDPIEITLVESMPFSSRLEDDILWIVPDKDQAGEGYVYLQVSDGEGSVSYWLGVSVKEIPDPPSIVKITSPANGSVLIPGGTVPLISEIYDPDVVGGDVLNVTWTSDRDGELYRSTLGIGRAMVLLSSGVHRITLRVEDETGNVEEDYIQVVVSVWGWGEMPWSITPSQAQDGVTSDGGYLSLVVYNNGSLLLTFHFDPVNEGGIELMTTERTMVLSPGTIGVIKLEIVPGLGPGTIALSINVTATTFNSTHAGFMVVQSSISIEEKREDKDEWGTFIGIAIGVGLILAVGIYLTYPYLRKRSTGPDPFEDEISGGSR